MRALRLLKFFHYSKGLAAIGTVLVTSFASFAAIAVLVVLFWVVFAIIGMNVFGGLPLDWPYPNFDTFLGSLLISFQVGMAGLVGNYCTNGYNLRPSLHEHEDNAKL